VTGPDFTSGIRLDDSTTTLVTTRKLPIVVSPVPHETVESYLNRLELANHLRRDILAKRFQRDRNWIDRLAKLTAGPAIAWRTRCRRSRTRHTTSTLRR
jgi:hypothetical protein